jgi:peroxiredoxin
MRTFLLLLFCSLIWINPCFSNSPELATGIRTEYQKKMELWTLSMQAATTAEAQAKLLSERPDGFVYSQRLWAALKGSLTQDWTIEPAGWLLKLVCSLPSNPPKPEVVALRTEIVSSIMDAVEKNHMRSAKLASVCMGLLAVGDNKTLQLLEKIEKGSPDRKVQGVAALALAFLLENLGDEVNNIKRRLTLIRKAIIESADVVIDGTTVAKMAEDQLYVIRYLSKGREAPDLEGLDVSGTKMKLSDFSGKVVVLLFWNTAITDYERVIEIHRNMVKKMEGKPFVLVGVTNDSLASLRVLQGDGLVTWRNFCDTKGELTQKFHVKSLPIAYVLDRERKIQYIGNPGSFVELTADALISDKP